MAKRIQSITTIDWSKVEEYLNEESNSSLLMSIVEAEKLLESTLKEIRCPGSTTDDKIKNAEKYLTDLDGLKYAREVYNKILHEPGFKINVQEVEKILYTYHQAVSDLANTQKEKGNFIEELKFSIDWHITGYKKYLKKIGISLFLFFLVVLFLDSTKIGRSIVDIILKITHLIFSWILIGILVAIGIIILAVVTFFYFESRKRKQNIRIEEK